MSVGLVPHKLLSERGVFGCFVVVLLLVEELVAVLPEGFEEIHPYHALELVQDLCGVMCCGYSIHPSYPNVPPGHHVHSNCHLLGNHILNGAWVCVSCEVNCTGGVFCE